MQAVTASMRRASARRSVDAAGDCYRELLRQDFLRLGARSSKLHFHHLRWRTVIWNPQGWPVGKFVDRQVADLIRMRHEEFRNLLGIHIEMVDTAAIEVRCPNDLVLFVNRSTVGHRKRRAERLCAGYDRKFPDLALVRIEHGQPACPLKAQPLAVLRVHVPAPGTGLG